jgi:hypothetical protein
MPPTGRLRCLVDMQAVATAVMGTAVAATVIWRRR